MRTVALTLRLTDSRPENDFMSKTTNRIKKRVAEAKSGAAVRVQPLVSTPICDKAKIEVLHCTDHGSGYLYAVDVETAKSIEQEKTFYRGLLDQVCQDARKTRARRLAESGLMFWDAMQAEKARRANDGAM